MSRGLGKTQRAVLAYLAGRTEPWEGSGIAGAITSEDTSVTDLASAVFGTDAPSNSQVTSVRRAVKSLADAGWVIEHTETTRWVYRRNTEYGPQDIRISETHARLSIDVFMTPKQQADWYARVCEARRDGGNGVRLSPPWPLSTPPPQSDTAA